MTEATTRTRAPRRSAEQLAAEAQARANSLRAKAGKAKRATETRQKVIAGSGLIGLAEAGDPEAMRVLDRVKAGLNRPQDRAAFGLPIAARTAEDAEIAIRAAVAAHKAIPETDRPARRAAYLVWRMMIADWERITGKPRYEGEARQKHGLGDLGEACPRRPVTAQA